MGIFWKRVYYTASAGGVIIEGKSESWPKGFFLWRFQHPWMVFEIKDQNDFYQGYWIYFSTENLTMRYRRKIKTRFFAARIGREDVRFSAVNSRLSYLSKEILAHSKLFNYLEIRRSEIVLGDGTVVPSDQITLI